MIYHKLKSALNKYLNTESQIYSLYVFLIFIFNYTLLQTSNDLLLNFYFFKIAISNYFFYYGLFSFYLILFLNIFINRWYFLFLAFCISFILITWNNSESQTDMRPFGFHDKLIIFWTYLYLFLNSFISKKHSLFKKQSISLTLLSSLLFASFLSKMFNTGFDWFSAENMRDTLLYRQIITNNPTTLALLQNNLFCAVSGVLVFIFQSTALLTCFFIPEFFAVLALIFWSLDFYILDIRIFLICMLPSLFTFYHSKYILSQN